MWQAGTVLVNVKVKGQGQRSENAEIGFRHNFPEYAPIYFKYRTQYSASGASVQSAEQYEKLWRCRLLF